MSRNQDPFAGWQGPKPPGNGGRRSNLPMLLMLLAIALLFLIVTAPIKAAEDAAPQVTGVSVLSDPAVGDTYGLNELIRFGLNFDTDVVVNGQAFLGIWIGSRWYSAWYDNGSGSDCLIFVHRVKWEDEDDNGVSVPGGYVDEHGNVHGLGGGSIVAAETGVNVNPVFAGMSSDPDHKVDWRNTVDITDVAIVSSPVHGDTYREGEALEVQLTYEESMVVEGDVGVSIYVGDVNGSWRGARYDRGAGTTRLVFSYTVQRTDVDESGFTVSAGGKGSGYFGNGFVRSAATGLYSERGYRALHDQADHKVLGSHDLVAPTVAELNVVTTPADRDYVEGEEIRIDVVFSEAVTAEGDAELELDFNGAPRTAVLVQGASLLNTIGAPAGGDDTLSFVYEVAEGDYDPDGFAIGPNKLRLTHGTIRDAAGNDAVLDHEALAASAVQCIDGRNHAPTFDDGASATRTVDEELDRGSPVGDPLSVTDPEGASLSFTLSGRYASYFAIDGNGQINTNVGLSFESRNQFELDVTVSDGLSTATLDLTIRVTDIDEPGRISVVWPPPVCTPVAHAYIYDPDHDEADHAWTWEISDNGTDGWNTIGHVESWDSTYSPTEDQANKFLRITVTYSDKFGSGKSVQAIEAIGPVEPLQNGCREAGLGIIGR